MIVHRLSTLDYYNIRLNLDHGRLVDSVEPVLTDVKVSEKNLLPVNLEG